LTFDSVLTLCKMMSKLLTLVALICWLTDIIDSCFDWHFSYNQTISHSFWLLDQNWRPKSLRNVLLTFTSSEVSQWINKLVWVDWRFLSPLWLVACHWDCWK
jgi:hypothetical protein